MKKENSKEKKLFKLNQIFILFAVSIAGQQNRCAYLDESSMMGHKNYTQIFGTVGTLVFN